jgi:dihydrofolate reductase
MKLTLMEFMSLDGVTQGPGAPDEDTSGGFGSGGWLVPHMDETFIEAVMGWVGNADAFLFGRRTYENFARDWPATDDPDDPFAPILNGLPKYVASRSPIDAGWEPTTILSRDIAAEVAELKREPGRELQIHGSAELAQSLFAEGLIDELRLVVAPVVVGSGRRLFPPGGAPGGLRLTDLKATPGGLALHVYEWSGAAQQGTYDRRELGNAAY